MPLLSILKTCIGIALTNTMTSSNYWQVGYFSIELELPLAPHGILVDGSSYFNNCRLGFLLLHYRLPVTIKYHGNQLYCLTFTNGICDLSIKVGLDDLIALYFVFVCQFGIHHVNTKLDIFLCNSKTKIVKCSAFVKLINTCVTDARKSFSPKSAKHVLIFWYFF